MNDYIGYELFFKLLQVIDKKILFKIKEKLQNMLLFSFRFIYYINRNLVQS